MSTFGVNLTGVNDWTAAPPLRDRVRVARPPVSDLAACDPISGLPTKAGTVTKMVTLDPCYQPIKDVPTPDGAILSRDYVLECDSTVTSVGSPFGIIKPVNGRGLLTVRSSSVGGPLTIHCTGSVKKFSFFRADHEKGLKAGELFHPDFVERLKGLIPIRMLDWNSTNSKFYCGRRPLPSDGYFWDEHGGMPAEYAGMLGKLLSTKLWYTLHCQMPTHDVVETAHALSTFGIYVDFEWGNELGWTYQYKWMREQASAMYNIPLALVTYFDVLRYYGFRSGQLALLVSKISKFFKVNLASQASTGKSNLPYILKGWDESGAPRSLIAGYANASYINLNDVEQAKFAPKYMAMMLADDKEAFYKNIEIKLAALLARNIKLVQACAVEGIPPKTYEFNQSFYTQAPWADPIQRAQLLTWATPLLQSPRVAEAVIKSARDAKRAGIVESCFFNYAGGGSQYGVWGAMPHITQDPYPIYNMLRFA